MLFANPTLLSAAPRAPCGMFGMGLVAAVLAVQGCGAAKRWSEVTNDQCNDRSDNDGDTLIDCSDPDCQATSICARNALWPEKSTGGVQMDAQSPTADGSASPPPKDASSPDAHTGPTMRVDSSTSLADAGVPEADATLPAPDASTCTDGGCLPPEPTGTISVKIRVTSAVVPILSSSGSPFDSSSNGSYPDPYVVILVNGSEVFRTSTALNANTPTWSEPGVRLDITTSDKVEFRAYDDDSDLSGTASIDDLIYACIPNLPSTQPTAPIDLTCAPSDVLLIGSSIAGIVEPAN